KYLLTILLLASFVSAADKRSVKIEVLAGSSNTIVAGSLSTGNATQFGNQVNGMAMALPIPISSVDISAIIDGHEATLHCDTANMWHCYNLRPGIYEAVVKGNTAWGTSYNWDRSDKKILKYRIR